MGRWLIITFVLLGAGCNQDRIARLEKQNQELQAQLKKQQADLQEAADLDLQAKCAKQAREQFRDDAVIKGWAKEPMGGFTNHYSKKLKRCFMRVENTTMIGSDVIGAHRYVFDAFEGKLYGEYSSYVGKTDIGKKGGEVAPVSCKVTSPSGEVIFCHSYGEFEELTKPYMK
ncbi:MAG: hypothetical protein HY531_02120 [Chloroflexi bacterium]|nr:hypothetical protein [Chloroflexota bacterium]